MRTMELKSRGRTFYKSSFDPATGTLVRMVDIEGKHRFDYPWSDDEVIKAVYPDRSWGSSVWSPVPETVDVSITDHCAFGCSYCLSPDTKVMDAGLGWRSIGDVSEGDMLVGFEEFSSRRLAHRKLLPSVVQAVRWSKKPVLRIVTETREIVTTGNHGWLRKDRGRLQWVSADKLRSGHSLYLFCEPIRCFDVTDDYRLGYLAGMSLGDGTFRYEPGWKNWSHGFPQAYWRVALVDEEPLGRIVAYLASFGIESSIKPFDPGPATKTPMRKVEIRSIDRLSRLHPLLHSGVDTFEYRRGWLSGFFDAEGAHNQNLRYHQKAIEPLEKVIRFASSIGFNFELERSSCESEVSSVRLKGSLSDRMRFLGMIRPAITRKTTDWHETSLEGEPDRILSVEKSGEEDVVDIQTSSATFFADGLATHNCYQDSRPKSPHGDKDLVERIVAGFDEPPYQIAIGGGEPTTHPDFVHILRRARELGTVPNFTTSGDGNCTDEILDAANEVCGGVAMTYHAFKGYEWFEEHYLRLKKRLRIQLNVHLIADKDVAVNLMRLAQHSETLGPLNIVLLAYYPDVGRASLDTIMTKRVYQKDLPAALREVQAIQVLDPPPDRVIGPETGMTEGSITFLAGKPGTQKSKVKRHTIAFSEGLLPYFNSRPELGIETRFAMAVEGHFSCYFDPRGHISHSSFSPPHKRQTPDYYDKEPTCFTERSQVLWNGMYGPHGPGGAACYPDCPHYSRCSTPHEFHYLACALANHNR